MRHKENKENKGAAKPEQKLKKDGTPDMRYKENKEAAKKKGGEGKGEGKGDSKKK